ncbi:hypothetical protein GCM10028793_65070 [Nocardiopsis oceani]
MSTGRPLVDRGRPGAKQQERWSPPGPHGSRSPALATSRNTAIGLRWAAGFDNITEANRPKLRDENRQFRPLKA